MLPQVKGAKKEAGQKNSKSMGRGTLTIEAAEINGNKVYLTVFRNLIGKTLY